MERLRGQLQKDLPRPPDRGYRWQRRHLSYRIRSGRAVSGARHAVHPNRPYLREGRREPGIPPNGVAVAGSAVTFSVSPSGAVTLRSQDGEPPCTSAPSTSSVTCNTDNYGVAYVDVLLGSTVNSNVTVTASASGYSQDFSGAIRAQPTISAGGVVDAAADMVPIGSGSYVSIYGANLTENFTDSVTYAPY